MQTKEQRRYWAEKRKAERRLTYKPKPRKLVLLAASVQELDEIRRMHPHVPVHLDLSHVDKRNCSIPGSTKMINWPWVKAKPVHKVKLDIINAIELKPEANYVLVADANRIDRGTMLKVMADLRRAGVRNVVSFMLSGRPEDAIQVISKEKKHATVKARR